MKRELSIVDVVACYKNIDENLFIYSKKFVYPSDILMAHFYIARLTSMEEYDKVISYSKRILKDAKKLLTKSDINLIKVQAINCAFDNKKNYELIREWWNNDFNKFMEIMQNINPTYLYINYVYLLRVINDKKKAKVLLDKFYMNEGKYSDKKNISYIKEKIIEVNKDDV